MNSYEKPTLTVGAMRVEDIISVDYTVNNDGEEISWKQIWTSALTEN